MRVHTEYNFPANQLVSLRLHLDEPLDVTVKRVWEKPLVGGMNVFGLQFSDLTELTLNHIRYFLDEQLQDNRRKAFRLERILVVEMQINEKNSRFGVFTLDLSTSGMRINHEEPLPEDCQLDFRILLEPGQAPVAVKSEVSWQKENAFGHYLIGLRFTDIDEGAEQRIEAYIHQALQRSSRAGGGGGLSSFLPPA